MKLQTLIPAALVAVLIVLFGVGLTMDPTKLPSPFIGKPAPGFDLEDLTGADARVRMADYIGKPFLVNVWGTWCAGCRMEHATLLRIARDSTLPIVGINWRDDRGAALTYLRDAGNPFVATGYDPEGAAIIDWGVYGAPETFVIDAKGQVVYKHVGPLDWRSFTDKILKHLEDPS